MSSRRPATTLPLRPQPQSFIRSSWTSSLSPKLSNSTPHDRAGGRFVQMHERQRLNFEVIQRFIDTSPDFQLKFVVSGEGDLNEVEQILERIRGWQPSDVLLMPEGTDSETLNSRAGWIGE